MGDHWIFANDLFEALMLIAKEPMHILDDLPFVETTNRLLNLMEFVRTKLPDAI